MSSSAFNRFKFQSPAFIGLFSLALATSATAASEVEQVTVTASRFTQPLSKVGVSVEVLTTRELESEPYFSLADVLRTVPGITVANSGGAGKNTSVFMRGEDAFRTQLYVDGIRISDNTGTQIAPRFDNLLNQQLGRVEVLKGPQALLYGADGGGIVSVFSKTAEKPVEADIGLEAGSHQYQTLSASLRGKNDTIEYSLNGGALGTQGFNARRDDPSKDNDGFRNANFHSLVRTHFGEHNTVGLVLHHNESNPEYDSCYDANFNTLNTCEDDTQSDAARLDWHYDSENSQQELAFTFHDNNNQRKLSDAAAAYSDLHGATQQIQYFGNTKINPQVAISLGLEAKKDNFQDQGPKIDAKGAAVYREDATLDQYAAFTEWQISPSDNFNYTIGGRYDDSAEYGNHQSFRFSSAYLIATAIAQLKLHGAMGNGFRVPSFYEIYSNNHPTRPTAQTHFTNESTRGAEIGMDAAFAAVLIKTTLFGSEITDEIYYDNVNYSGYVQTPGTSSAKGIEIAGQWQASTQLKLNASYTHTKTRFGSAEVAGAARNKDRLRRPRNIYNLGVDYLGMAQKLELSAFYRTAYNAVDYGGVPLEDYAVLDINGGWHFTSNIEAYLRVLNALEENYQEVRNYNADSLSAYAGLRLKF